MFKKLKSLFIEEIEDDKQGKAANTRPSSPAPPPRRTAAPVTGDTSTQPVTPAESSRPGQVSDKFMTILFGAMDKNNLDGFDYLEFKNSLNSLKKVQQTDEATRFKSAYAMAQTMGVTKEKLLQTAEHYMNVLLQEERKFEQALDANMQKQVGTKEQRIKALAEDIKAKQAQIEKLRAVIEKSKAEHQKLKSGIQDAKTKIENTKADFIASYEAIRGQIKRDADRIREYL